MSEPWPGVPCLEALCDAAVPLRLSLVPGSPCVIGRGDGVDVNLEDNTVSRRHAEARLEGDRLRVRRLTDAKNPVIFQGRAQDEFTVASGEHFVIGRSRLVFRCGKLAAELTPRFTQTVRDQELYRLTPSSDRLRLLDLLELPELLRIKSEPDFYLHVARLLRLATGALWVRISDESGRLLGDDSGEEAGDRRPVSRTLVQIALEESPKPTLFRWAEAGPVEATRGEGVDWAICAASRLPAEPALVFYAAGADADAPPAVQGENARLVGLVADCAGRTLSVRRLEARERRLERFFSPPVIAQILGSADSPQALEPRKAESTVMFFDIRDFSQRTESETERILEHIGQLKCVMTAMTDEIFRENGVVLHYVGDGLLACWNLPVPDERHVDRACRAALAMRRRLKATAPGWRCGIGLHTGEVVAGAMGSEQLFVYSVLGPVVNQASRIEGITKFVEAPVLVSREVAERVRHDSAVPVRLGRFRPKGMTAALDLFELTPPPGDPARATRLGVGVESLSRGDWEGAYEALDGLPAKDLPARFLKSLAEHYRRHPPKDWHGVIELEEK